MIILTGAAGFIGKNIYEYLKFTKGENNIQWVDIKNSLSFRATFKKWDEVKLIIHQGAISSTVETNLKKIFSNNSEMN